LGERYVTRFNAPRQSDSINTLPASNQSILLTQSKTRWMTMSPSSSPLYAFATSNTFENNLTTLPRLLLHLRTNTTEHRFGNRSLMYNTSVRVTSVPLEIDLSSHTTPLDTHMCSHSHMFPHDCSTSRKEDGTGVCVKLGAIESSCQCSPSSVSCTEHIISCLGQGWLWEYWNQFGFCPETTTSYVLLSVLTR
jgi:hypothetical protein